MDKKIVIKSKNNTIQFVQYNGPSCVLRCFDNKEQLNVYRTLSELSCEYLPEIFNIAETADGFNVWEEYIDGLTLEEYVGEKGCLKEKEILHIALQLTSAIEAMHKADIIHRDIKPGNIMIAGSGRVVLIDFNAARLYTDETKPKDTRLLGTEGYAAPEQYGFSQTDFRTDFYGLGATLYELRSGTTPDGKSVYKGKLKRPIEKCLSFNPDDRYKNAGAFRLAIKASYYQYFIYAILLAGLFLIGLICTEFIGQAGNGISDTDKPEYDQRAYNQSERVFQGEEIPVWRVAEEYIDLSAVPLNKEGFLSFIKSESINSQIKEALGKEYDGIINRYTQGVFYFSYDETNGIYFAQGPVYAWEITCGGTVHFAYIKQDMGVENSKIWEYTNETRQACGEEMKNWFLFADEYIEDATCLYDEMSKIARE